jgi:hypothetical protein
MKKQSQPVIHSAEEYGAPTDCCCLCAELRRELLNWLSALEGFQLFLSLEFLERMEGFFSEPVNSTIHEGG